MAELELVFKRGLLYDGTGGTPLRADLGVRGHRIAAIGANLSGAEQIDCDGLCLAPGFIDSHAHSDLQLLTEPTLEMKVRQGVTMEVIGLDGMSVAPLRAGDVANRRDQLAALLGSPQLEWSWRSVASFLDALDEARPALAVVYLAPHGAIRESIMGLCDRKAAPHDIFRMKGLLARCLDEGAFGVSMGLAQTPCFYAEQEELVELAGVAASRHVPCVVHLRSESDRLLESVEEMAKVGRDSGAHIHISHLKSSGRENWGRVEELVALFEDARRDGVTLSADVYPYDVGSSLLTSILPPWVLEGGHASMSARLSHEPDRQRIRAQILDAHRTLWDNQWKHAGPEGLIVWDIPSGRRRELVGKSLALLGQELGREPVDVALDLLRDERGAAVVCLNQSEAVMERLLQLPFVNVCTGGQTAGRPHPRSYGAFPRILSRYVREKGMLTLEQAVRKMTGLTADTLGLDDFGYLLEGKRANVVAFDAARVKDTATLTNPASFPEGVVHVAVGGKLVVKGGQLTAERPGRAARRRKA